ncbi:aminopeptidase P family protein [Geomonas nitrogeniifigens]|uniref:Aminopeptidase P family protein n=1 Tax=Geomonas diazotrophica TaxID=2843197 RepID=A0ABX8JH99_9BACT|nr:aminopeptidase P family protein [Geomonas nitrogeniifigens]QWV96024.1 aminopeptidase P family protein [Geomonas nitrogeniifigens]QXE85091.1 aminopeptidase P family protein [Geomonas nitrogeniifigens]
MIGNRIPAARECLKRLDADLLLVLNLSNIRYLTGFTGSEALLVLSPEDGWFFTDSRYTSQAGAEVTGAKVIEFSNRMDALVERLQQSGATRVAFEAGSTTVAFYQELCAKTPQIEYLPADSELTALRTVKDAGELEILERVAAIASESLLDTVARLKPGMTESEVAWMLEVAMRERGAEGKSFDFIVASGERGALPHGRASEKKLVAGELVTIDYGAIYRGYCSDETVTVCLGRPDAKQREVYETVLAAQRAALDAVHPGLSFRDLDSKARDHIAGKGYGEYFGHGLGHGVGIDIHEHPTASPRSKHVIQEGMVFTIEPGIYIPGWGGVRIEDTVVVEQNCCRPITRVPKGLMIL